MKKKFTAVLALALSMMIMLSAFTPAAYAASSADNSVAVVGDDSDYVRPSAFKRLMYNALEKIVNALVSVIGGFLPSPDYEALEDYVYKFLPEGTGEFLDEAAENARWSLGYDSRSYMTDDVLDGKHYVGGSISVATPKAATEIHDDLKVRTVAVNDGSGRGSVVFAAIDAYGFSSSDVSIVRERLAEYAAANDIAAINIPALHQHSVVDTFGMNGNILDALVFNPARIYRGAETKNGKNPDFQENLFEKIIESVKAAVENMETGSLYYSTVDVREYMKDKRAPYVNDPNLNRLRFVPDDASSNETWVVTTQIHCVGLGAAGTAVSSDYPYYVEQVVNDAGANLMMVCGATQNTTMNTNSDTVFEYEENMSRYELLSGFGISLGYKLTGIDTAEELELAPLLNLAYKDVYIPIGNKIIFLGSKIGLFDNKVLVDAKSNYYLATEIAYLEIGDDLAFAMVPGELAPELAYGACFDAEKSWFGTDWEYPSMQDIVGDGRILNVLGLMNDQVGYIVPDNNHIPMLADESGGIEFVSPGSSAASRIVTAFESLVASVK